MPSFKPMLCADTVTDELLPLVRFPVMCSPKKDGLRAITTPQGPRTRKLKPIGNDYVSARLRDECPVGLDGELGVIIDGKVNFRMTQSVIRKATGQPEFRYFVFDLIGQASMMFTHRYNQLLCMKEMGKLPAFVEVLEQVVIYKPEVLKLYYHDVLKTGDEGIIMRSPSGYYKHGRSTMNEQYLMRMKPRETDEAIVIGVEEEFENLNDLTEDELGYAKRSSEQAGKFGKKRLGSLVVRSGKFKHSFKIGTGFTAKDRIEFWKQILIGKIVHYSYDPTGGYDKPRQAVFIGFRDKADL